jgi:hypothetical protein
MKKDWSIAREKGRVKDTTMQCRKKEHLRGLCALFLTSDEIVICTGGAATGKVVYAMNRLRMLLPRGSRVRRGDRRYGESAEDVAIIGKSSDMARERRSEAAKEMSHHHHLLTRGLLASLPHALHAGHREEMRWHKVRVWRK